MIHALTRATLALLLSPLFPALPVCADPPKPDAPQVEPAPLEPGPLAPFGYPRQETTSERLIAGANMAPGKSSIVQLGVSREGRPLEALVLGEQDMTKKRPALLLVGGMDGVNLGSTEQVFGALEVLLREHAEILDTMRIYAIPTGNPDARDFAISRNAMRATNARIVDDDRDGQTDEDAPGDYDGDGQILTLRRVTPPGESATHLLDAADPRIVRPAHKEKGERATHDLHPEAVDNDLDGRSGEDADGGVDLDKNFPHRWPEFSRDAGPYQLSEPESLAIAKFVRDHSDIVTAVVFGRHDTLVAFPETKDKDFTGRTPMVYLSEDHALYRDYAKLWKESTKIERSQNADLGGSLVLWLANHRGVAAVAANGWARPEVPKPEAPKPDAAKPEDAKPADAKPDAAKETPPVKLEPGDAEQAAWLELADKVYKTGFVEWHLFKHPIYGSCEIGGFMPFYRECPTIVQARDLAKRTAPFVVALAAKRPAIEVSQPRVTPLTDGLVRIELRVTNTGTIGTTTEMGRTTDVVPPVVVRLLLHGGTTPVPFDALLSGRPVHKLERIAPGASQEFTWIVRLPAGGALNATVSGPFFDTLTREIRVEKETKP